MQQNTTRNLCQRVNLMQVEILQKTVQLLKLSIKFPILFFYKIPNNDK